MKKLINDWWVSVFLGILIIVVGLGLRFCKLDLSLPVFADEAIYVRWAQIMKNEPTLRFLPLSDGKQPLFMWLVIPSFKLFSDPLFAGRAVSVLASLGTAFGLFLLALHFFKSKKVALIVSLIYMFSPFTLFFDRMALVDSLLSFFGVWVLYLATLAFKRQRLDFAMLTGFFLGGGLLTKSPALFFSLLIPTTWLLSDWPKGFKKIIFHLIKLIALSLPVYLIGYGLYNVLRLGPNFNMIGSRNADYIFPLSHLWTNPKDPFIFLIDRSFEWIRIMGPWPLLLLALGGIILNFKKSWKEVVLLLVWFIVPVLVQSEFAKVYTARYILFTLPYLMLLAASVFIVNGKVINYLSTLVLFVFIFLSLRFDYLLLTDVEKANLPRSERSGYLEEWTSGTGIREIAGVIEEQYHKEPGKKIVVGTEGFFGTLPDGLQIYLSRYPEITVIGVGIIIDRLPTQLAESRAAGNKTYLVVNSSRFKVSSPEAVGLSLIAAYPKAFRPEGFKEYVQNGPRDNLLLYEVGNIALKVK